MPTGVGTVRFLASDGLGFIGAALDKHENIYVVQGGVTNSGTCTTTDAELVEYSAGGLDEKILRTIAGLGTLPCSASVAVDPLGDVYVGWTQDDRGLPKAEIREYGPTAKGRPRPLRKLSIAYAYVDTLAGDASGDLFAMLSSKLYEYPAGSTTQQAIFPQTQIAAFTLDAKANIYAVFQTGPSTYFSPGTFTLEKFAPGSTTPKLRISGPDTGLYLPKAITVAP